jgi:hypothetical protein
MLTATGSMKFASKNCCTAATAVLNSGGALATFAP